MSRSPGRAGVWLTRDSRTERSATSAPAARPTTTFAKAGRPAKGPRVERAASVIDMRSPSPTPSPPSQPLERFSTAPLSPVLSPLSKLRAHELTTAADPPSTPSRVAMSPDSDSEETTPTLPSATPKTQPVSAVRPTKLGSQAASPKRPTWAIRPATPPAQARDHMPSGTTNAATGSHDARGPPEVVDETKTTAAKQPPAEGRSKTAAMPEEASVIGRFSGSSLI